MSETDSAPARRRPSRRASSKPSRRPSKGPKHVTKDHSPKDEDNLLEPTPLVPSPRRSSKASRRASRAPSRGKPASASVTSRSEAKFSSDQKSGRRHSAEDGLQEVMRMVSSSSIQSTPEGSSSGSRSTKSLRRRRMSRGPRVVRKSVTQWAMPGIRGAKMAMKEASGPRRVLASLSNTLQHVRSLNRAAKKGRMAAGSQGAGEDDTDEAVLPPIFCDSIVYLRQHGLQAEGIFRIPGDREIVHKLKERFDKGDQMFLEEAGCEVHDVATLLKMHITERPLITGPTYIYVIGLWKGLEGKPEKIKAQALADAMHDLPLSVRVRLAFLVQFLYIVAHLSSVNLMTTKALSVVWAPVVFVAPDDLPLTDMLANIQYAIEASRLLIEHADMIQVPMDQVDGAEDEEDARQDARLRGGDDISSRAGSSNED